MSQEKKRNRVEMSQGQNFQGTTSQGQNVPGTKHPKDKTFAFIIIIIIIIINVQN